LLGLTLPQIVKEFLGSLYEGIGLFQHLFALRIVAKPVPVAVLALSNIEPPKDHY
jgi:hypothetical protein